MSDGTIPLWEESNHNSHHHQSSNWNSDRLSSKRTYITSQLVSSPVISLAQSRHCVLECEDSFNLLCRCELRPDTVYFCVNVASVCCVGVNSDQRAVNYTEIQTASDTQQRTTYTLLVFLLIHIVTWGLHSVGAVPFDVAWFFTAPVLWFLCVSSSVGGTVVSPVFLGDIFVGPGCY
jgi:hypothetical protein